MTSAIEPVRLGAGQVDEAGEMLARAFFDDPSKVYLTPSERKRKRILPWLMRVSVLYGRRYGEVYTTPNSVGGAAVWLPPGDEEMTPLRMLRAGMLPAPFKLGLRAFLRFLRATDHLDELHKRDVPDDHWYLILLGVDPERQGQGVGGSLIQPIIARADASGLPCYLETMKERNVTFYRKHGFEVLVEDDLPSGGLHYWTMKRQPERS